MVFLIHTELRCTVNHTSDLKITCMNYCSQCSLDNLPVTYILTPCCRVLPEKLTGLQLVNKFPSFHETRRFITATPPVSILDQPNPVHIPTSYLLEIHPNIIHASTPRSPSGFPTKKPTWYTIKIKQELRGLAYMFQCVITQVLVYHDTVQTCWLVLSCQRILTSDRNCPNCGLWQHLEIVHIL